MARKPKEEIVEETMEFEHTLRCGQIVHTCIGGAPKAAIVISETATGADVVLQDAERGRLTHDEIFLQESEARLYYHNRINFERDHPEAYKVFQLALAR